MKIYLILIIGMSFSSTVSAHDLYEYSNLERDGIKYLAWTSQEGSEHNMKIGDLPEEELQNTITVRAHLLCQFFGHLGSKDFNVRGSYQNKNLIALDNALKPKLVLEEAQSSFWSGRFSYGEFDDLTCFGDRQ